MLVNAPFLEEDEQYNPKEIFRARCFRKFQWIKTPQYLPIGRILLKKNSGTERLFRVGSIGMVITLGNGWCEPLFYEK